jgi:hypothetical protein
MHCDCTSHFQFKFSISLNGVGDTVSSKSVVCKVSWTRNFDEAIPCVINSIVFQPPSVQVDQGIEVTTTSMFVLHDHCLVVKKVSNFYSFRQLANVSESAVCCVCDVQEGWWIFLILGQ